MIRTKTPIDIKLSAILKTGQWYLKMITSKKSTTNPCNTLSIILPIAPPSTKANPYNSYLQSVLSLRKKYDIMAKVIKERMVIIKGTMVFDCFEKKPQTAPSFFT